MAETITNKALRLILFLGFQIHYLSAFSHSFSSIQCKHSLCLNVCFSNFRNRPDFRVRSHRRRIDRIPELNKFHCEKKILRAGYHHLSCAKPNPSVDCDNILPFRFPNSTDVKEALRSPVVELGVACLVLTGCLLFALETLKWDQATALRLALAEDAISWAFVVEYFTRWYSRNFRPSYVLKIEMLIDLLAVLPLLLRAASLTGVKELTFLRVLRVLRLQRFFLDAESFQHFADSLPSIFGKGFRVKPYQLQVLRFLCSATTVSKSLDYT